MKRGKRKGGWGACVTVIAYGNHRQDFCAAPSCCAISYEIETICNNVSDVSARFAAKVLATPTKHNAHKSTSSSGSHNLSTLCHVSPGGNVIGNYIICRGAATAQREGGEELGGNGSWTGICCTQCQHRSRYTHRASKSRQLSPAIQFPFFDFASHFHYF